MCKITKKQLQYQINGLAAEASTRHNSIMRIHRALASIGVDIFSDDFDLTEPKPQLKQLDKSVFDGLDADYNFAAIDGCTGRAYAYEQKPHVPVGKNYWRARDGMQSPIAYDYDASNWQNSLIERDAAKELLEVDLSSELTGSDLCRAVLKTRCAVARVSDISDFEAADLGSDNASTAVLRQSDSGLFYTTNGARRWFYAVLINNQGEPLTASEVGL